MKRIQNFCKNEHIKNILLTGKEVSRTNLDNIIFITYELPTGSSYMIQLDDSDEITVYEEGVNHGL